MEGLDMNHILGRETEVNTLENFLERCRTQRQDLSVPMGLFITGPSGCGKSTFVDSILKRCGYDPLYYGASGRRTKDDIESMATDNMADRSVISMFSGPGKPIAIVMDEIEMLGSGTDKGAMSVLVKLVRAKRTKKQKEEVRSTNPVICIGQLDDDKRTREITKVCERISLRSPTPTQMSTIAHKLFRDSGVCDAQLSRIVGKCSSGNLHRLSSLRQWVDSDNNIPLNDLCSFLSEPQGDEDYGDTKVSVAQMLSESCPRDQHDELLCSSDRAVAALLWHENVPTAMTGSSTVNIMNTYQCLTKLFCQSDCLDRLAFQRQAWQLGQMSSVLKNLTTTYRLHASMKCSPIKVSQLRFTKILTKYSSEYSNAKFVEEMCRKTGLRRRILLEHVLDKKGRHDLGLTDLEYARLDRYVTVSK